MRRRRYAGALVRGETERVLCSIKQMIWFFERKGKYVRCETRKGNDGAYELVITAPDGTERVERFEDSGELARRQVDLEHGYAAEGWTGPHGRVM